MDEVSCVYKGDTSQHENEEFHDTKIQIKYLCV